MDAPQERMIVVDNGVEDGITWVTCCAPIWGAVNGYVKIPAGHLYADHGNYEGAEILNLAHDYAPGGLTYADGDWIGFDTLHLGDWWPGMPEYLSRREHDREWTPEAVADATRHLARHVAEIGRAVDRGVVGEP
jgi:hypothetical protein